MTSAASVPASLRDGLATDPIAGCARVLVWGGEGGIDGARRLAVLLDELEPLDSSPQLGPDVARADALIVPGAAHVRALRDRVPGAVLALGVPRLDAVLADPDGARREARRSLGVPLDSRVFVYSASAPEQSSLVPVILEHVADLIAPDRVVVLRPHEWPRDWLEAPRALAASRAGLVLLETDRERAALLAADVVIGDRGLQEARALGKSVVRVAVGKQEAASRTAVAPNTAPALTAALGRALSSPVRAATDLLESPGRAAGRFAEWLACFAEEDASSPRSFAEHFRSLEARAGAVT